MPARGVAAVLWGVPAVVVAGAVTVAVLARAGRRLGASEDEAHAPLPGDELLPGADVQNDRACTIPAPPERVWPWIAQLGQDKAGFYSFEYLENLLGCRISGAGRIHPEWQDVRPGDVFRLHPEVAMRVARVEPGRLLAVTSEGGQAPGEAGFDATWVFHLRPVGRSDLSPADPPAGPPATRLHVRERYRTRGRAARVMIGVTGLVSAVMSKRMMSRISELAASRAPDRKQDRVQAQSGPGLPGFGTVGIRRSPR